MSAFRKLAGRTVNPILLKQLSRILSVCHDGCNWPGRVREETCSDCFIAKGPQGLNSGKMVDAAVRADRLIGRSQPLLVNLGDSAERQRGGSSDCVWS